MQEAQQGCSPSSCAGAVVHGAAALCGATEALAPDGAPAGRWSCCARTGSAPGSRPGAQTSLRVFSSVHARNLMGHRRSSCAAQ